jgi:hypothetical protein
VLRLALAAVFLYAAILKWPAPRAFAEDVANYRLLPPMLVPAASAILLGLEVTLGVLLLAGVWQRATALVSTLLCALFTAAVVTALVRGLKIECGCFGAGGSPLTTLTLLRDLGLLALSGVLVFMSGPAGSDAD